MSDLHLHPLLASIVYSVLGIVLLVSFFIFDKLTQSTLRKEILEDQNTALAIMGAAFMLAVALIISAAIHGRATGRARLGSPRAPVGPRAPRRPPGSGYRAYC